MRHDNESDTVVREFLERATGTPQKAARGGLYDRAMGFIGGICVVSGFAVCTFYGMFGGSLRNVLTYIDISIHAFGYLVLFALVCRWLAKLTERE